MKLLLLLLVFARMPKSSEFLWMKGGVISGDVMGDICCCCWERAGSLLGVLSAVVNTDGHCVGFGSLRESKRYLIGGSGVWLFTELIMLVCVWGTWEGR